MGVLALLGSGEIAPSMTKVHRQLLNRLGEVRAVSLDTPYGFQANVPQMTEKIVEYFATSLQVPIAPLDLTSYAGSSEVQRAIFRQEIRGANYVFAGPGSPSWAVRQWAPMGLAEDLESTLRCGGIVCFASAAALTLGEFTAPIYEIYKVGADVHWIDGLDVLSIAGIRGAIIPHFDNAEGGNYDTRYCYLGESRLIELEKQLPDGAGILGIDEHTAAIIDLEQGTIGVMGKGNVHWRRHGSTTVLENNSVTDLGTIRSFEPIKASTDDNVHTTNTATPSVDELTSVASAGGPRAIEAIAQLARMASTGGKGFIDPSLLVSNLLALRVRARSERNYTLADEIRDTLTASGIEVMDGSDGSSWQIL